MRERRCSLLILSGVALSLAGCSSDAILGHRAGGSAAGLACPALAGAWTVEAPEPVAALNFDQTDIEPFVAPDGLTLYYSSQQGTFQDYQATRASTEDLFTDPIPNPWVPHRGDETRFAPSANGREAFLAATWPGGGKSDLYRASRADSSEDFGAFASISELNTPENEYDPLLSADGRRLYFMRGSAASNSLMVAERASATAAFEAAQVLPGFADSPGRDDNPSLSPDETLIFFASDRPGGAGGKDVWYATRSELESEFGDFRPVPVINTVDNEGEPFLFGCELYFSSDQPGTQGGEDLYRTHIVSAP